MCCKFINNLSYKGYFFILIALMLIGSVHAKQKSEDSFLYLSHTIKERNAIKALYPKEVQQTLKIANQIIKGEYIFRYEWDMEKTQEIHEFDGQIDWLAMPNGDPEWCYMLNRHKYWIDLGRAYWLTGDEKYAEQWVKDCSDWIARNPKGTKKGLANSWRRIEVGIRCENWIKTYEYVKGSRALTLEFVEKFKNSLIEQAAFLDESFSFFSKTSNWGILEYNGLYCVSLFLKDDKNAEKWKRDALERLNLAASLQMGSDGVQWEKSPMYHNEVLHCLENVVFLGERFSDKVPFHIVDAAHKMALANLHWMKPNGNQPLYGDSDDTPLTHMWVKPALTTADPLLKRRVEVSGVDYSNYFDLSKKDLKKLGRIKGVDSDYSTVYQDVVGDLYMRSGWGKDDVFSSFHMKNLYCGHGHDDLLHFTLFAHGRDYLVDGGRFTYVEVPEREYFKSSKAHNTIGVDGEDNALYQSSWSNKWEASSDYQNVVIDDWGDWAEANNKAYIRLNDPVMMKRSVLYIKPSLWLINDCFESKEVHRFNQYFNYSNDKMTVSGGEIKTTYHDHNISVSLDPKVRVSKEDSFWSKEYNLKTPATRFVTQCEGKGLTSLKTLVYDPDLGMPKLKSVTVTNRNGVDVPDTIAEAFEFNYNGETFVWFVQHNYPAPKTHFYIVDGRYVNMRVGLWKKSDSVVNPLGNLNKTVLLEVF
ncbi:heparinase II/III family protein [Prolixibacteraceae bacterium]|nr:heparinase II/III family protein [Prolixibacteraceae bacterium]